MKILSHSVHLSWTVLQSQRKELGFKGPYTICHKEELPQQCKESISRYKGEKLVVIIIVTSHCYQLHTNFYPTFFLMVNSIIRWNYWLSSLWIFSTRSTTTDIFCIHQTLEINFMFTLVWNTKYYYHYIWTLLWNMPWGRSKKTRRDWNGICNVSLGVPKKVGPNVYGIFRFIIPVVFYTNEGG